MGKESKHNILLLIVMFSVMSVFLIGLIKSGEGQKHHEPNLPEDATVTGQSIEPEESELEAPEHIKKQLDKPTPEETPIGMGIKWSDTRNDIKNKLIAKGLNTSDPTSFSEDETTMKIRMNIADYENTDWITTFAFSLTGKLTDITLYPYHPIKDKELLTNITKEITQKAFAYNTNTALDTNLSQEETVTTQIENLNLASTSTIPYVAGQTTTLVTLIKIDKTLELQYSEFGLSEEEYQDAVNNLDTPTYTISITTHNTDNEEKDVEVEMQQGFDSNSEETPIAFYQLEGKKVVLNPLEYKNFSPLENLNEYYVESKIPTDIEVLYDLDDPDFPDDDTQGVTYLIPLTDFIEGVESNTLNINDYISGSVGKPE